MTLSSTVTDNITELLVKITDFTKRRYELLMQNIANLNTAGFIPKDLDVDEFAELITQAISEHVRSQRLLLCDGENIKFGSNGQFESLPIIDEEAKQLFEKNVKKYLQLQVEKLSENLFNSKLAAELLKEKQRQD